MSEPVLEVPSGISIEDIANNLREPDNGPAGNFIKEVLKTNVHEEVNAARLCQIQAHHHVLELGFGIGQGLEEALTFIKDGTGTLSGVDISEAMMKEASNLLDANIQTGKVSLKKASVDDMPFESNLFDRVFHCNCYYFWPDRDKAACEIFRVMKPGSLMVTVLNLKRVRVGIEKGVLKAEYADTELYIESLKRAGFTDVKMENLIRADGQEYQGIFAYVPQ